ncbi:MAG: aspartate-semialdehyde dehydrogenase [Acidobacteriota bacterium]|nr:aspartate-semialdehyde dehydrogenase [Acidobacteriota bacterium]
MSEPENSKRPVAILGATGVVGQHLVQHLVDHPWFVVSELVASDRSAGRPYAESVTWRIPGPVPDPVRDLVVREPDAARLESDLVFSALDASVAREIEAACAARGKVVVSNARSHRMDDDVPLIVPEVNAGHLELVEAQRERRGWGGFIVTNPNCSVIGLTLALAPIAKTAGIRRVVVTTMQALSGAGYPGVASIDVADNVVPAIPGEEEKIASEPRKILGRLANDRVVPADLLVSAHTHRVGVSDGHLLAVSLETDEPLSPADAAGVLAAFRGEPPVPGLPSAPPEPVVVLDADDRPQPRLDRMRGRGMTVSVGRVRACPVLGLAMEVLSHNTIRGAAGGTLLIAELLAAEGRLA